MIQKTWADLFEGPICEQFQGSSWKLEDFAGYSEEKVADLLRDVIKPQARLAMVARKVAETLNLRSASGGAPEALSTRHVSPRYQQSSGAASLERLPQEADIRKQQAGGDRGESTQLNSLKRTVHVLADQLKDALDRVQALETQVTQLQNLAPHVKRNSAFLEHIEANLNKL